MKKKALLILFIFSFVAKVVSGQGFCRAYKDTTAILLSNISNRTFTGLHISANSTNKICISLINCSNIHITKSLIEKSLIQGIYLQNCHNITIDSVSFQYVACGVNAFQCTGNIHADNNQFLNMQSFTSPALAHAVQYNLCTGPGQTANFNKIQSDFSLFTGDLINFYKSTGTAESYMQANSNWILGGGINISFKSAGIILGDISGKYQEANDNILVNTGYAGIQVQGGTYCNAKRNKIFGAVGITWSGLGLGQTNAEAANPQPAGVGDTITLNQVRWYSGMLIPPGPRDLVYKPANGNVLAIGWAANIPNAPLTAAILPATIYQACNLPVISYTPSTNDYLYGYTIQQLIPTNTGTPAINWSISPALPAGLNISSTTGIISGTPTVTSASANYVVTATNTTGSGKFTLTFTVNKAPLVVTAVSKVKYYKAPNPALTVSYSGFKNGDSASSLTTQPTATTTAGTNSLPGIYPIVPAGGVSSKYTFSYVDGILFITLPNVFIPYGHFGGIVPTP